LAEKVPDCEDSTPRRPTTRDGTAGAAAKTTAPPEIVRICPGVPELAVMTDGNRPVWAWRLKLIAPVVGEISEIGFVRMFWNSLFQTADWIRSPGLTGTSCDRAIDAYEASRGRVSASLYVTE
jgi:hypothetical protein